MLPSNDNARCLTHVPANDNAPRRAHRPPSSVLLALAGYDPKLITSDRSDAFKVAQCWESGLFDVADIARAVYLTRTEVRRAIRSLRLAAKPGTVCG
jgi:hypothetical protein